MQELITFAHGMGNFAHNRGRKKDQERLIRDQLDSRHKFLGAFGNSGNFAFVTSSDPRTLQNDTLAALRHEYKIKGVVVIDRAQVAKALDDLHREGKARYGQNFQVKDYAVWKHSERYRLGFVLMDKELDLNSVSINTLKSLQNENMEIVSVQGSIVSILKKDPKKPRIPWGEPAATVANLVVGPKTAFIATGRSARTVRGILRKFPTR